MGLNKYDCLEQAKTLLKDEVTSISFNTWIKNIEIESISKNVITLIAQSKMHKETLETRFYDLIKNTFDEITHLDCVINIIEKSDVDSNKNKENKKNPLSNSNNYKESCLSPKYTFDNFVVGNNNNFAHAAAMAVAEEPAVNYNPLFIYGGVGLGKTHLMQAIGNKILENNPDAKVLYVTSETFINELVNSIKDSNYKNSSFKEKYRNIDVLLVDDIQFIAGKKTGQEEFFHTFNTLFENGKQIILSSDKPPRDIPLLEERLKSRFEWGVLADISQPDYETRLAILRKKVQDENLIIDDNILSIIATKINSNIRELEGALKKIVAYSKLTHSTITVELTERALTDFVIDEEKVISSNSIQETVANYFNIDKKDLISSKKSNDIVYPRQIAMYLCREVAQMSFPKIGEDFGSRDHATVMYAYKKISNEIKTNPKTKLIVESVKNIIEDKN